MILLFLGFIIFCFGSIGSEINYYNRYISESDKCYCIMRIVGMLSMAIYPIMFIMP